MAKNTCTCGDIVPKAHWTSQDYDRRYTQMRACPIHSKVPDIETMRYENVSKKDFAPLEREENIYMQIYAVVQAVGMNFQGIKAFDTNSGYRAIATFSTREDARAYLLEVLDTVKREQKAGIRTVRNLDPTYEGGLDFHISPAFIVVARQPLKDRRWKLSTDEPVAKKRKLTHTINKTKGRKRTIKNNDRISKKQANAESARKRA